jgi:hypothetical protein
MREVFRGTAGQRFAHTLRAKDGSRTPQSYFFMPDYETVVSSNDARLPSAAIYCVTIRKKS